MGAGAVAHLQQVGDDWCCAQLNGNTRTQALGDVGHQIGTAAEGGVSITAALVGCKPLGECVGICETLQSVRQHLSEHVASSRLRLFG